MQYTKLSPKSKTPSPLNLSILTPLNLTHFKKISNNFNDSQLFHYQPKNITLILHHLFIPQSKLLTNLQIYQWRCQTEFPIIKTYFVNIKENLITSSQGIQLDIYNQYCPLKLMQIYQISLPQCLYLLKQSFIGFQRLYDRFGGFQIKNSMITINEKGFCKVWFHQNFGINLFPKKQLSQKKMTNKIITILQSHTKQSRRSKKFFNNLKNYFTFLDCLKNIQHFIKQYKIIVPSYFILQTAIKLPSKIHITQSYKILQNKQLLRFSVRQQKQNRSSQCINDQFKTKQINHRLSCTPFQYRKIKNHALILETETLKKSDGQSYYTGQKNNNSGLQLTQNTIKQPQDPQQGDLTKQSPPPRKSAKWISKQRFAIDELQLVKLTKFSKIKKQLTCSESLKRRNIQSIPHSLRKYSCKLQKQNTINLKYHNHQMLKNSPQLLKTFSDKKQLNLSSPMKIEEVDEQQKQMQHHSRNIFQNNGWVSNVSGLLQIPPNFLESYHDQTQSISNRYQIPFKKPHSVGSQQIHQSRMEKQFVYFV